MHYVPARGTDGHTRKRWRTITASQATKYYSSHMAHGKPGGGMQQAVHTDLRTRSAANRAQFKMDSHQFHWLSATQIGHVVDATKQAGDDEINVFAIDYFMNNILRNIRQSVQGTGLQPTQRRSRRQLRYNRTNRVQIVNSMEGGGVAALEESTREATAAGRDPPQARSGLHWFIVCTAVEDALEAEPEQATTAATGDTNGNTTGRKQGALEAIQGWNTLLAKTNAESRADDKLLDEGETGTGEAEPMVGAESRQRHQADSAGSAESRHKGPNRRERPRNNQGREPRREGSQNADTRSDGRGHRRPPKSTSQVGWRKAGSRKNVRRKQRNYHSHRGGGKQERGRGSKNTTRGGGR